MSVDEHIVGEVKRGQQILREKIVESDRLIDETQQLVEESRAFASTLSPANRDDGASR